MATLTAVAFTDGANTPHREVKHAASAVVLLVTSSDNPDRPRIFEWARYLGDQTNNVAELCGIELAVHLHRSMAPESQLTVRTDSQYCEGIFTYDHDRDRWLYKARKNAELVQRIRSVLPAGFRISWVRGHAGDRHNERADQLAVWAKVAGRDWHASYDEYAGVPELPQLIVEQLRGGR